MTAKAKVEEKKVEEKKILKEFPSRDASSVPKWRYAIDC
jgi:hypothetical protein